MKTERERLTLRELMVTKDGKTQSVPEWGQQLGILRTTLRKRAERGIRGEALIAPAQPRFGNAPSARVADKTDA